MKVKCIKNSGSYWFNPFNKISKWLKIGQTYEARDLSYYEEYSENKWRYLIATEDGSKNFPVSWFKLETFTLDEVQNLPISLLEELGAVE